MKRLILTAAGLAMLTACGGLTGEVVGKNYEPGYYTTDQRAIYRTECHMVTRYRTISSGSGTTRRTYQQSYTTQDCRQVWAGTEPYQRWHPSCARLTVRDGEGKIRNRCVSESKFYSVEVGQKVEDF